MNVLLLLCLLGQADSPIVYLEVDRPAEPTGARMNLPEARHASWTEEARLIKRVNATRTVLYQPPAGHGVTWACPTLFDEDGDSLADQNVFSLVKKGARTGDIYIIDTAGGEATRLTFQELDRLAGDTSTSVLNTDPCVVPVLQPDGTIKQRILYCSDATLNTPTGLEGSGGINPSMYQLWAMDMDGSHKEKVGFRGLGAQLNPVFGPDGRVHVGQWESHNFRGGLQWGIWSQRPDGSDFAPEWSAFMKQHSLKFPGFGRTATGEMHDFAGLYYPGNNGFGSVLGAPTRMPDNELGGATPRFTHGGAYAFDAFMRVGRYDVAGTMFNGWADWGDRDSRKREDGSYYGKITHPSIGPQGWFFVTHTTGKRGTLDTDDMGIYLHPVGVQTSDSTEMTKVVDEPDKWEFLARSLTPLETLYGAPIPAFEWLPDDTTGVITLDAPHGVVCWGSLIHRETRGIDDAGGTWRNVNLHYAGAEIEGYTDDDIDAMRFFLQERPPGHEPHWRDGRTAITESEKLKIIGDWKVGKKNADGSWVLDPSGKRFTGGCIKLPANVSIGMVAIDSLGRNLQLPNTWKDVRPQQTQKGCLGCHVHTKSLPYTFEDLAELMPPVVDFTKRKPSIVEYERDVLPILATHGCVECHDGTNLEAPAIDFPNLGKPGGAWPMFWGNYSAELSKTVNGRPLVQPMQSRKSALVNAILHADGFSPMPKDGPKLSDEEIRTIIHWVDTAAARGPVMLLDHTKPVLHVGKVREGKLRVGALDTEGPVTLAVKLDGTPLAADGPPVDDVFSFPVSAASGEVEAVATDEAGNVTRMVQPLRTGDAVPPPPPPDEPDPKDERIKALEDAIRQAVEALEGVLP